MVFSVFFFSFGSHEGGKAWLGLVERSGEIGFCLGIWEMEVG